MIFDKLWRTQWRRRRYIRTTERKIKELREQNKYDEANELEQEQNWELGLWHQYIQAIRTEELVADAERLGVPLPIDEEGNKVWRYSEEDSGRYLTQKAQVRLKKEIRQERKERREAETAVIKDIISPIGALIISILSLLIAFAALKLKH